MRRLLLATTAIGALALAPALAFAQTQPGAPAGAVQEQPKNQEEKAPQGGKPVTPAPMPGKSAQTQTAPQTQNGTQNGTPKLQGQTQPKTQVQTQQGTQQHAQNQTQTQTQQHQGTATATHTQVRVTAQQRTQIHERFARVHVERIEHPTFSVRVGVEIPRTVHIDVLPPEIVEIVPQYEGFDYVMVGNEILIIDPNSMQIIAVIPA